MTTSAQLLAQLPEWADDMQILACFTPYNGHPAEQWQLDFWKRAIGKVVHAADLPLLFTSADLANAFCRKGKSPSLAGVLNELTRQGVLSRLQDIRVRAQQRRDKRGAIRTWFDKLLKSEDSRFVITERLHWITKALHRSLSEDSRNSVAQDMVLQWLTEHTFLTEDEALAVLDYMCAEGLADVQMTQLSRKMPVVHLTFPDTFKDSLSKACANITALTLRLGEALKTMRDHHEGITQNLDEVLNAGEIATARVFFSRQRNLSQRVQQLEQMWTSTAELLPALEQCATQEMVFALLKPLGGLDFDECLEEHVSLLEQKFRSLAESVLPNENFDGEFDRQFGPYRNVSN